MKLGLLDPHTSPLSHHRVIHCLFRFDLLVLSLLKLSVWFFFQCFNFLAGYFFLHGFVFILQVTDHFLLECFVCLGPELISLLL